MKKEKFFIPDKCKNCKNTCKKEISIAFKAGFDSGEDQIFCKRYIKNKGAEEKLADSKQNRFY